MNSLISNAEEKLKTGEYKLTDRRKHILTVLLENRDKHLSAEEIYRLVKQKAPDTGLATVYRTLEIFLLSGIIQSIDFGDARRRYEYCPPGPDGRHHHLICSRCGKVIEVDRDLTGTLESVLNQEHKFKTGNHHLNIFGLCEGCRPNTLTRKTG
ncbi:ferric uptake regulation protein FUR [Desulfocucumis palustris]|uniref:Ferric uptake regulation protein FUR n=1 Tax=Desulfocucumis palustris TaxID=1898651 RepID=A0A2L2XEG3_9FIRM|nr:Fur family transcriptional regulator [Desulfocucumis palustris]GBF34759.1 ferric uptake regulation protein FUR [Desulfocucumis palustris]